MLMLTNSSHGLFHKGLVFTVPTATHVFSRTVDCVSDALCVMNHAGLGQ